jgi:uncharacterized protein YndB with AHSA1/START domain
MNKIVKKKNSSMQAIHVQFELRIESKVKNVWNALVQKTEQWWPKEFLVNPQAKHFVIEATMGGHVYEDWGQGNGVIWFSVIGVDKEKSLRLRGDLMPDVGGGPGVSQLLIQLEARDNKTILRITDSSFGLFEPGSASAIEASWYQLFNESFRPFAQAN